jgi:hypothetical protein
LRRFLEKGGAVVGGQIRAFFEGTAFVVALVLDAVLVAALAACGELCLQSKLKEEGKVPFCPVYLSS